MTLRHVSYSPPKSATRVFLCTNSRAKMVTLGKGRKLLAAAQESFSNYKPGFGQAPGPGTLHIRVSSTP